jgi:hypothetical protein
LRRLFAPPVVNECYRDVTPITQQNPLGVIIEPGSVRLMGFTAAGVISVCFGAICMAVCGVLMHKEIGEVNAKGCSNIWLL